MALGRRLPVVLLVALGLAACGDTTAPAASPSSTTKATTTTTTVTTTTTTTTTDDGQPLELAIERSRLFGADRLLYLTFRATAGADAEVTAPQLRSELFELVPPSDRTVPVRASGDPVSIPIAYGAAACVAGADRGLSIAMAVDGVPAEVSLGEAAPAIVRLHDGECAANEVRRQVELGFGPEWRLDESGRVLGTLTLDARPGSRVELAEVALSVVLTVEVSTPLPATDDIDVVVTAARCDAHALTESKKTFTFVLTFADDGGDPVRVELRAADGPPREAMAAAIEECVANRSDH